MQQTLELVFRNALSQTVTVRIPYPKENVTSQEISAVMDFIIQKNPFTNRAETLVSKEVARIVTRSTQDFTVA